MSAPTPARLFGDGDIPWDREVVARVISLGAGVQSTALVLLAVNGELQADVAIFADTQAEPPWVYEHLWRLALFCAERDFPIVVVTRGSLEAEIATGAPGLPLHAIADSGKPFLFPRWCTANFKITPIYREIRRRFRPKPRTEGVDVMLGISVDEITRAKPARVRWARNRFPLLDLGWDRADCLAYCEANGFRPASSSCFFCPFHSVEEWLRLPSELRKRAIEVDETVRRRWPSTFLTSRRIPLRDLYAGAACGDLVDLKQGECEGYCFL